MTVRICVHVKAKSLKMHQGLWNLCEPLLEWVEEHLWWLGVVDWICRKGIGSSLNWALHSALHYLL